MQDSGMCLATVMHACKIQACSQNRRHGAEHEHLRRLEGGRFPLRAEDSSVLPKNLPGHHVRRAGTIHIAVTKKRRFKITGLVAIDGAQEREERNVWRSPSRIQRVVRPGA